MGFALGLGLLVGCGGASTTVPLDFGDGTAREFMGLAACSHAQPIARRVDPDRPLVLLVHGCSSSGGRFRSLAEVFELHGQQVLCFNYDYRDSLRESADQLRAALLGIRRFMRNNELTVIGHSQGGLVSRAALSGPADEPGVLGDGEARLVTVSSPFAGIRAASDCGSVVLHVATLGISVVACQIATGSNWSEIHPKSAMVREPAPLLSSVSSHLAVMTDERGVCRRFDGSGECDESDFVFTMEEQDNPLLAIDGRMQSERIAAGHVEIVGESGMRPEKLIDSLQRAGVLAPTPPDKRQALAALLSRLF
jgi:pimeloyl-ACP methyl ester carboxylesterase